MEIAPSVRSSRFTQLDPGDLFIGHYETGSYVGLAVKDPHTLRDTNATDKMVLLLGPASPSFPKVPIFINFPGRAPVVSFAKDYKVRLPSDRNAWLDTEPRNEHHCLVLAEDALYMKALLQTGIRAIPVYISIKDGRLTHRPLGSTYKS